MEEGERRAESEETTLVGDEEAGEEAQRHALAARCELYISVASRTQRTREAAFRRAARALRLTRAPSRLWPAAAPRVPSSTRLLIRPRAHRPWRLLWQPAHLVPVRDVELQVLRVRAVAALLVGRGADRRRWAVQGLRHPLRHCALQPRLRLRRWLRRGEPLGRRRGVALLARCS
ncbi:unnamed protein product, partial [Prorocentrum cordatum]